MTKQIISAIKVSTIATVLFLGFSYAYAWTGPTSAPPGNNTPAPINVGTTFQWKNGDLMVNGFKSLNGITTQNSLYSFGPITTIDKVYASNGVNAFMLAPNEAYRLVMQSDGNLVLYYGGAPSGGTACWSSAYGKTGSCSGVWPSATGGGTGVTGPAGPAGPQGPAGPTGPQGPAGSSGGTPYMNISGCRAFYTAAFQACNFQVCNNDGCSGWNPGGTQMIRATPGY